MFVQDLENTRDYEIESANGINIRSVLEEMGEKVKITLFGKLDVWGDKAELKKPSVYAGFRGLRIVLVLLWFYN